VGNLDDMRLPLTILLGALIIGGIVGAVGISMQPKFDDSRLEPITVEAPTSTRTAAPPPSPATPPPLPATQPVTPTSAASLTTDIPAPPPATFDPIETTDDGGHHRGGDDRGRDDGGHGGGDRSGSNSGPG
jgi:hypothetical protein